MQELKMKCFKGLVIMFLMCFFRIIDGYDYDDVVQLRTDILDSYDTRQRPVSDQTHPVYVVMTFHLLTIQGFDEVAEKFSVFGLLSMSWQDQKIQWDPNDYNGASTAILKLSDVWYPKLVLIKPYTKLTDLGDDWMTVRIFSSGHTAFVPGAVFETSCSVDVTYYPFDTQVCSLNFNVWGYVGYEVVLLNLTEEVNTDSFTENGEWSLVSTSASRVPGDIYRSDEIHFNFFLKRKSTFLVVNVILPIIFMTVINLLVFVLPAESGERVSFSVTVLLALAVFMTLVGDNLPKTSEPMSILSFYLMSLLVMSTLMTVTTIFNLKLYFKDGQVPACLKGVVRYCYCFPCRYKNNTSVHSNKVSSIEDGKTKNVFKGNAVVDADAADGVSQEEEKEPEITWQDVSCVVDKISLIIFLAATIIVNSVFLETLVNNR